LRRAPQLPGHRDLAAAHVVSVGSMCEAISMLIRAELIETPPGRGTYVSAAGSSEPVKIKIAPPLERHEVEELTEARLIVEVELAARRFGDLRIGVVSHRRLLEAIEARDPVAARAGTPEIMAQNRQFVVGLYGLGVPAGDEALV
jgi:DNA-binding FadR family transcriptional regulator